MIHLKKLPMFLFSLSFIVTTVYADRTGARKRLSSPGLTLVRHATLLGAVKPTTTMQFTVWLKLRNKEQLDQLVRELYDPNSLNYHKFLTKDEFNQQYAPSLDVEQAVQHYFTAQGMQAKIVNHSVRITATARQVEQALQVKMNHYRYQSRTVYANATAPSLSADIAQYVAEISGLSDIARFRPTFSAAPASVKQTTAEKSYEFNLAWDSFIPLAQPTTTSFAGFTGAHLQKTYNLTQIPLVNGGTINGAGQTLIVIDACGSNNALQIMSDANQYNNANSITPFSVVGPSKNLAVINPDGSPYTSCGAPTPTGWEAEIALDVESSHTIAPGANTILVLTQTAGLSDMETGVADVVDSLITNDYTIAGFPNAYVVSNSWGSTESHSVAPFMETILEKAAAHGISFNFSTGDCGDETYTSSQCTNDDSPSPEVISVNYPASSAYVTAVGGTSVFVDNSWNYAFETVWGTYINFVDDDPLPLDHGFVFGGGGGISQYYGPVALQRSINGFTAGGYGAGTVGQYNKRALPDIAMLGDPFTGLIIYLDGARFPGSGIGGTSLACPLFAGTLTLINQARALLNKNTPIGLAAPYLYTANATLLNAQAINRIIPPHQIINGATPAPAGGPLSAFTVSGVTFGWDSSLTITPESQFWNDAVGVGSPNIPNFVTTMATL